MSVTRDNSGRFEAAAFSFIRMIVWFGPSPAKGNGDCEALAPPSLT